MDYVNGGLYPENFRVKLFSIQLQRSLTLNSVGFNKNIANTVEYNYITFNVQ